MTVLVLTACPEGLRGHLTRWLMEISAGVFVGHVSARVRSLLWARVVELAKDGRAIMVYGQQNEQRLAFKVHGHHWEPVDYDGLARLKRAGVGLSASAIRRHAAAPSRLPRRRCSIARY